MEFTVVLDKVINY